MGPTLRRGLGGYVRHIVHGRRARTGVGSNSGNLAIVKSVRQCVRSGCTNPAVATLTYVYSDSTAVIGPLATEYEPHSYDLCARHAERLTVPRGWEIVRLQIDLEYLGPSSDDLAALADAVRGTAARAARPEELPLDLRETGRRGHLRMVPGEGS